MHATHKCSFAAAAAGFLDEQEQVTNLLSFRAGAEGQQLVLTTSANALHVISANGTKFLTSC